MWKINKAPLLNIRHFYYPPTLHKIAYTENYIEEINNPKKIEKTKFCCFVVSNGGCEMRNKFFKKLCEYKKVDSFGKIFRNCDVIIPGRDNSNKWEKDYLNTIGQYKFMITFENILGYGITSEKIINAFKGNTLPIYWGNQHIYKMYNKGSFINTHDFKDFEEVIRYIEKVDSDDLLNQKILNSKKIEHNNIDYKEKIIGVWKNIFNFT